MSSLKGIFLNRKNIIFLFISLWFPLQKKTSLCNIRCHYRTLQPNLRIVDTSPNGYIYKVHLYLRYWKHWIDEVERFQKPEDYGVYCETLCLSNVRNYTYKVSPTWSPEQEQNTVDTNTCVKLDREKLMRTQDTVTYPCIWFF